jgi:hypothetical protein
VSRVGTAHFSCLLISFIVENCLFCAGSSAFAREAVASEETLRQVCRHFGPRYSLTYCAALTRQLPSEAAEILNTIIQKVEKWWSSSLRNRMLQRRKTSAPRVSSHVMVFAHSGPSGLPRQHAGTNSKFAPRLTQCETLSLPVSRPTPANLHFGCCPAAQQPSR